MKNIFVLVQAILFASATFASAAADSDLIFDARVGAGATYSSTAPGQKMGGAIDVSGMLLIGDQGRSNIRIDMALVSAVRDGGAALTEADVALKGRFLRNGRFGFEVSALPFKYRRDDNYYELSGVEISAVYQIVKGGHTVQIKGGINPYTKRWYPTDLGTMTTSYDPVSAAEGFFVTPRHAYVEGAPAYRHDPDADMSFADNRYVYFGGGTMTRQVDTTFENAERSVRVPLSIAYQFKSADKKLTISATAYYTLRAGKDSFDQVDSYTDRYDGYVSYSNVAWDLCRDEEGNTYYCRPYDMRYGGYGHVVQQYSNTTSLKKSDWFLAHTVGGQAQLDYSVFKNEIVEVLLNGRLRAELDSHAVNGDVDNVRGSRRVTGTAGAIVRF